MAVQMIIKYADSEKKVVGKKNILNELEAFTFEGCSHSDLHQKRKNGSNCKILLRK